MEIDYEAIAVGALLFTATLIWIWMTIRSRKREQALADRLRTVEKELDASQMQASRRLMSEIRAHSNEEVSKTDPTNPPQLRENLSQREARSESEVYLPRAAQLPFVAGLPPVDPPPSQLNYASTEQKTRRPAPLLQRQRIAFLGAKTILIGGAIASALVYIFDFQSSPPEIHQMFAPLTASIELQRVTGAPLPQALPPMIEAQRIPATTEAEREIRAPSLQVPPEPENKRAISTYSPCSRCLIWKIGRTTARPTWRRSSRRPIWRAVRMRANSM